MPSPIWQYLTNAQLHQQSFNVQLVPRRPRFKPSTAHRLELKMTSEKENINPEDLQLTLEELALTDISNPASKIDFALAFDIDGVLLRGPVPVPGAPQALKTLQENGIPYVLLTNGGGLTEAAHALRIGHRLEMTVTEDQFVQSHTPFKGVASAYADKWVLILGGSRTQAKEIAVAYGLNPKKVINSSDLHKQSPTVHPFSEMTFAHHDQYGTIVTDFTDKESIAAVFVFSSPRDWCLDLQVCIDLLLSEGGVLGTRSPKNGDPHLPNHGYQQDGQPRFYFCNPDLEWATQHVQPRLAQGAFRAALEGVWLAATKGKAELQAWSCGKPTTTTYRYAEGVIKRHHRTVVADTAIKLRKVYMIGDNPESDIQGAVAAERDSRLLWKSVLVETGVHKAGSKPAHTPTVVKKDVFEAVRWIIQQEMGDKSAGDA